MKGYESNALAASSVLTTIHRINTPVKEKMNAQLPANRAMAEVIFFLLARGIYGDLTVRQQIQHFLVRHIMTDILKDFSQ